jgi:hypothetical protein
MVYPLCINRVTNSNTPALALPLATGNNTDTEVGVVLSKTLNTEFKISTSRDKIYNCVLRIYKFFTVAKF